MDRKKDIPGCTFSGTLRISFETEKITFHIIHPHIHKASMMISKLNPPFFCARIRGLCKYVSKATPSSVGKILGRTLPQSIIDDWDFLNIDLSFFRSVYQNASEVMEYRAKYKSTGNWEHDVTKMEQLILGSNGLLAKRFIMGGNSAILLCNRNIFRVMIMEKPLLIMDRTSRICCYPDSKMISIGFRDKYGHTKVGCTAVGIPKDESSENVMNFFSAIMILAQMEFVLLEHGTFLKLQSFIIDGSVGEEKEIIDSLNKLGASSQNVNAFFFVSDISVRILKLIYQKNNAMRLLRKQCIYMIQKLAMNL